MVKRSMLMYVFYFFWIYVISNKILYEREWMYELIEVIFKMINDWLDFFKILNS